MANSVITVKAPTVEHLPTNRNVNALTTIMKMIPESANIVTLTKHVCSASLRIHIIAPNAISLKTATKHLLMVKVLAITDSMTIKKVTV